MTGFSATVLADSVAPGGERLTTVQATFPRFILAELNTHRMLSRNSASSRAIPTAKLLEQVRNNPVMPVYYGKNQSGMQAQEEISQHAKEAAMWEIEGYGKQVAGMVEYLGRIGLHKQSANRYLEPWMWHTAIISGTEWTNFFAQRDTWPDPSQPPGPAQPEFAVLSRMIREAMEASTPKQLVAGQWHLPLVETDDESSPLYVSRNDVVKLAMHHHDNGPGELLCAISAARCARVSYLTHDGQRNLSEDMALHNRLVKAPHPSPLEHVARAMPEPETIAEDMQCEIVKALGLRALDLMNAGLAAERWSGNFRGWVQYRKMLQGEHVGNAPGDMRFCVPGVE